MSAGVKDKWRHTCYSFTWRNWMKELLLLNICTGSYPLVWIFTYHVKVAVVKYDFKLKMSSFKPWMLRMIFFGFTVLEGTTKHCFRHDSFWVSLAIRSTHDKTLLPLVWPRNIGRTIMSIYTEEIDNGLLPSVILFYFWLRGIENLSRNLLRRIIKIPSFIYAGRI